MSKIRLTNNVVISRDSLEPSVIDTTNKLASATNTIYQCTQECIVTNYGTTGPISIDGVRLTREYITSQSQMYWHLKAGQSITIGYDSNQVRADIWGVK